MLKNELKKDKAFYFIVILCLIWCLILCCGSFLAPFDPYKTDPLLSLAAPDNIHLLGCDRLGRDLLSRLLTGAVPSFLTALAVLIIALCIGTGIGLLCAFNRIMCGRFMKFITDLLLAFPRSIAVIFIAGTLSAGITGSSFALCLFLWPHFARITYAIANDALQNDYIKQAKISGENTLRIIRYYLFYEIKDQLLITALLDMSAVILALSTLSFLGLSSQPPLPEWGSMLYENRNYLDSAPHLLIYPTLCIFISAFLFNLLGQMYASRHAVGRINL